MNRDKKIINVTLWFFAIACAVILLTSCSPYEKVPSAGLSTPTPSQAATASPLFQKIQKSTPTPRPSCTVAGTVYLREDPSKARAPLAVLRAGQVLEVLERGDWLKVTAGNMTGFIYSKYCK